jgi:putative transposase
VPEIINSDQRSHFTNPDYIKLLEEQKIKISLDDKGQALDNVRTERFLRTLKYDPIYINEFKAPSELRRAIGHYINEYNTYRPHSSIGGLCPDEVYFDQVRGVA